MLSSIFRRTSLGKKDEPKSEKVTLTFRETEIGLRPVSQDNKVVVAEVANGSEAAEIGVKPGDIVIEVNGKDCSSWSLESVKKACSTGRPLKLTLLRSITSPESRSESPMAVVNPVMQEASPSANGMLQDPQNIPSFPAIGCKFDCLHKNPLNEELRGAPPVPPNRVPPEPKTGWRWRPCIIQSVEEPPCAPGQKKVSRRAKVKFLDIIPTYPQEDIVELGEDNQFIAPLSLKSPGHIMHHSFRSDDILDVLDIFPSKFNGQMRKKWRKCQVVSVSPYFIRVTFSGWSEAYDIWIHVLEEADRLAEFGMYTERQQLEETTRERDFRKKMLAKGLQVFDVSPDGNCLFRAVSMLLYGDESHHAEIRQACCDYMERDQKRFEFLAEDGDFSAYIKNMRNLGVWGDEPELRVIEEIYDRPISMYSCDIVGQSDDIDFTEPMAHYRVGEEVAGLQNTEPLRLSFHGNNHYNAVILVNGPKLSGSDPTSNKQRIRRHRLMQGAVSMASLTTVRSHNSFSLRRSNSATSSVGK